MPSLTWDLVQRLRDAWPGTLVAEGILHPEDADSEPPDPVAARGDRTAPSPPVIGHLGGQGAVPRCQAHPAAPGAGVPAAISTTMR